MHSSKLPSLPIFPLCFPICTLCRNPVPDALNKNEFQTTVCVLLRFEQKQHDFKLKL